MSSISESFKVNMKNRPAGFISRLTRELRGEIKDNTPVRTGRLQDGWRAKGTKDGTIEIWNNVDYASYVEDRGRSSGYASEILNQRYINRVAKEVQRELE